jgi:hypothetical protein
MWFIVIINATLATTDLFPGGNSRTECEQMIQRAMVAEPQPLPPGIRVACVDSSQVESWRPMGPPAKQ